MCAKLLQLRRNLRDLTDCNPPGFSVRWILQAKILSGDRGIRPVSLRPSSWQASSLPLGLPWCSDGKESTCNAETWVWSLGAEDPLEEGMSTHSSILAWRTPMDRGAWWATVHGAAKSQTRLSD